MMLAKRLLQNNKGFSLVEAIIAFAIAAIAGVAVFGFMSSGTNMFKKTSNDVGLQYEEQMVVNKVREYLSEASNAINYDDAKSTLYMYNTNGDKYELERLTFYKEDSEESGKLVYANKDDFTAIADVSVDDVDGIEGTDVGENVKDITYDLSQVSKGKVTFDIVFLSDGKEVTSRQIVYLRNAVVDSSSLGEVYTVESKTLNSFIKSITIMRDGNPFPQNGKDTVKMLDDSDVSSEVKLSGFTPPDEVVVTYTAKVEAKNEFSDRTYSVVWDLKGKEEGTAVDYASVDPSTGKVTISKDAIGKTLILYAISVDDSSKVQQLEIEVSSDGVYPYKLDMPSTIDHQDFVGYREYMVYPIISYTDGTQETDSTLCDWSDLTDLPDGVTFNPEENKLTATAVANGETVKLTVKVKAPCVDGTHLTREFTLMIEDVPDYIVKQKLSLTGTKTKYNNRADVTYINAVWENAEVSKFDYYWEIEEFNDDESHWGDSKANYRQRFNDCFYIRKDNNTESVSNGGKSAHTTYQNRMINIYCEPYLDWNRTYKVKVKCYAVDEKGNKYGIGNEKDKNYQGPVESIIVYDPVEYLLKPKSQIVYNSQTIKLITDQRLLMSSYRYGESWGYATLRQFEIEARGLNFNKFKTNSMSVYSETQKKNVTLSRSADFDFYDNKNQIVTIDKNLYGSGPYVQSLPMEGFYLYMSQQWEAKENDLFKNAYNAKHLRTMDVRFKLSDNCGNKTDGYIMEGNDNSGAEILTPCLDYKYSVVFDKNLKEKP